MFVQWLLARSSIGFALCACALIFGCVPPRDDTQEIVDNLIQAGFPPDDISVVSGAVYVGRDAEVSLAASREMIAAAGGGPEQYRTTNLVGPQVTKVCLDGAALTGVFSTALDLAIQNYDEQPLHFAMARLPSAGCSASITVLLQPGLVGGSASFPSGGVPAGAIIIGDGLAPLGVDTIEHVMTHELGHAIGLRHADFFNRSISCGTGGDEGDAGVGAIHIPGTPTGAAVGGSIMNSCFRSSETGEFTSSDVVALRTLYTTVQDNWRWCHKCQGLFFGGNPGAACPAGGAHERSISANYHVAHNLAATAGWQGNWRWCHKCQGMFFGGNPGSVCPVGGPHDGSFSFNYSLLHAPDPGPDVQPGWRWCHKCQGMFFGGNPGAVCPAGGAHDGSISFDYRMLHR